MHAMIDHGDHYGEGATPSAAFAAARMSRATKGIPPGYTPGIPPASGIYPTLIRRVNREWCPVQMCAWTVTHIGAWYRSNPDLARQVFASRPEEDVYTSFVVPVDSDEYAYGAGGEMSNA